MALPAFPSDLMPLADLEHHPPFSFSDKSVIAKFAKVLSHIENIAKTQTADTGRYTYTYADLGDVLDEVKRVCNEHGLVPCQIPGYDEDKLTITTVLLDEEGEWLA